MKDEESVAWYLGRAIRLANFVALLGYACYQLKTINASLLRLERVIKLKV